MSSDLASVTAAKAPLRVVIGVITYRRPEGLERLLDGLDALEVDPAEASVRVLVVDNDPAESARKVCEPARAHPLTYAREPRRGIPQARNAVLTEALGQADCIAFIDDDEVPEPDWLAQLLGARRRFGADVVTGPSRTRFLAEPAAWIEQGGFFSIVERRTGDRLGEAFTGNVLIARRVFEGMAGFFDEGMALSGGSDVEFFRRVAAAGHSIVWCGEAVVYECVPASRMTLRWLLQRDFRFGAVTARLERRDGLSLRGASHSLLRAGWCVAKGLLGLPLALARGRARAAWSLDLAAVGAGRLWGLFGFEYQEYRETHGA